MHRGFWAVSAALAAVALTYSSPASEPDRLVVLVRHAEKAADPPDDPSLSDAGHARAAALASALDGAGIGAVIVTPFRRTTETAGPLAAAAGLTPLVVDVERGMAAHLEAVAKAVRALPAGLPVLIVGHSNTIPAIIGALGGPTLPDLCETEYARLFVMVLPSESPPRLVEASYGAPDPPGSDTCH